eukprot:1013172-Ditylum_brightwellii.AAC.1
MTSPTIIVNGTQKVIYGNVDFAALHARTNVATFVMMITFQTKSITNALRNIIHVFEESKITNPAHNNTDIITPTPGVDDTTNKQKMKFMTYLKLSMILVVFERYNTNICTCTTTHESQHANIC